MVSRSRPPWSQAGQHLPLAPSWTKLVTASLLIAAYVGYRAFRARWRGCRCTHADGASPASCLFIASVLRLASANSSLRVCRIGLHPLFLPDHPGDIFDRRDKIIYHWLEGLSAYIRASVMIRSSMVRESSTFADFTAGLTLASVFGWVLSAPSLFSVKPLPLFVLTLSETCRLRV